MRRKTIWDYTECDEIADSQPDCLRFFSFDAAVQYVRGLMPDESVTIVDNIAERLWQRGRK